MSDKENQTQEPQAQAKTVVASKQRYFVPALGRQVEANDMAEVEEIVKKENAKAKGEVTKGQGK